MFLLLLYYRWGKKKVAKIVCSQEENEWDVWLLPVIPACGKLRQEDCLELAVNTGKCELPPNKQASKQTS